LLLLATNHTAEDREYREIHTACSSRRPSDSLQTFAFRGTRTTSQPIRDPAKDHLLTPENSALSAGAGYIGCIDGSARGGLGF